MSDSWTTRSAEWLQEQIKKHPSMDKKELRKWCSKNYPYAEKKGWAYKAWCKAMRQYFEPQAVRPVRNGKKELSPSELEKQGQMRLM